MEYETLSSFSPKVKLWNSRVSKLIRFTISILLELGKENPGYVVTRTIHHLEVKIKCKIE